MPKEMIASAAPLSGGDPESANLIDRDAVITTLFWTLVQKMGGIDECARDANGNHYMLLSKSALKVNANYAVRMTDQGEGVRITPVHK